MKKPPTALGLSKLRKRGRYAVGDGAYCKLRATTAAHGYFAISAVDVSVTWGSGPYRC